MTDPPLRLRDAHAGDVELIFRWANDERVRRMSFSPAPISWSDHQVWFTKKLADDACLFFVVEDDTVGPIAQLRFDLTDKLAVVSVSVAPEARGRGIGSHAIRLGTEHAARRAALTRVDAYIRPDNTASVHAFRNAGFSDPVEAVVADTQALRMTWIPDEGSAGSSSGLGSPPPPARTRRFPQP